MLSNFRSIAEGVVSARGIASTTATAKRIWEIDRKLDRKEINLTQAMDFLKKEFSYHLNRDDYSKIKKEVGYNIK